MKLQNWNNPDACSSCKKVFAKWISTIQSMMSILFRLWTSQQIVRHFSEFFNQPRTHSSHNEHFSQILSYICFLSLPSACGRAKLLRTEITLPKWRPFSIITTFFDELFWQIFLTKFLMDFFDEIFYEKGLGLFHLHSR